MKHKVLYYCIMFGLVFTGCANEGSNANTDRSVGISSEAGYENLHEDSSIHELGLSVKTEKATTTGVTLIFQQENDAAQINKIICGDEYVIEKKNNSGWEELPVTGDQNDFNDIGNHINLNGESIFSIEWNMRYGELLSGEYRVKKRIVQLYKDETDASYIIYAYFAID